MSGVDGQNRSRGAGYAASILGLSSDAFALLRDLVRERTGIFFEDAKRDVFADKLAELVVERGLTSFLEYYYLLRYDEDAERYWLELRDRLAVPETFFWRQAEQFQALVEHVVPAYFRRGDERPLRIWSAACCSGEEPFSIVMALAESGWLERVPIEIVASDASPALIERARAGVYRDRAFRSLPDALRERYFERRPDGSWQILPRLQTRVQWRTANLVEETEIAPLASADVIFCRNVFIYFSDEATRRVTDFMHGRMPAPGYLFLGASESLTRLRSPFELREIGPAFVYVKEAVPRDGDEPPRQHNGTWRRSAAVHRE